MSLTTAQQTTVRAFACVDNATARPMMLAGDTANLRAWLNAARLRGHPQWRRHHYAGGRRGFLPRELMAHDQRHHASRRPCLKRRADPRGLRVRALMWIAGRR